MTRKTTIGLIIGLELSSFAAAQDNFGYDPALTVTIHAFNGEFVDVPGPKVQLGPSDFFKYEYKVENNQISPDEKNTVVHYIGNIPKYWNAVVFLVNAKGKLLELKDSIVRRVVWSEDSRYLIGLGDNTMRIWNLSGGVRKVAFGTINAAGYADGVLCIDATNYSSGDASRVIELYTVPILRKILSTSATRVLGCNAIP